MVLVVGHQRIKSSTLPSDSFIRSWNNKKPNKRLPLLPLLLLYYLRRQRMMIKALVFKNNLKIIPRNPNQVERHHSH